MSLTTLGRNAVLDEKLKTIAAAPLSGSASAEAKAEAKQKIDEARKSIIDTLTPWIPGDFIVTYGIFLTAWESLRGSFVWLLIVATGAALTYVVLGAFSATGFKQPANSQLGTPWNRLAGRTIAGFVVSVYAAVAIPNSGWYDFKWFRDNELAWVLTASVLVIVPVYVLKGLQKRLGISLENENSDT